MGNKTARFMQELDPKYASRTSLRGSAEWRIEHIL
jgi:hypothetical protein